MYKFVYQFNLLFYYSIIFRQLKLRTNYIHWYITFAFLSTIYVVIDLEGDRHK